jgi:methionyl-tRNA formyltransferase
MRVAIIGRTETLYDTTVRLRSEGHKIASIVTSKEAPEYKKTAEDFEALARDIGARFFKTSKIDTVGSLDADIGVSMNYTGVVPQSVIGALAHGVLNAHGGDLPRYRGNACHGWAILNGESKTAVCVHKMVGGELDSGDIIARDYFPLTERSKVGDVLEWVHRTVPELFSQAVSKLAVDAGYILERQTGQGRRCYPMLPEDGSIDWSKSAQHILRVINASARPFTGAYCSFGDGQKVTIWDAELVKDDEEFLAAPGHITKVGGDFLEVATGCGKIRILEMSLPFSSFRSIRKRFRNGQA